MNIQTLRLERGWSQEHLAEVAGLSSRTIQRIENGRKAGLESLKCLAAVFEVDVSHLMQEHAMTKKTPTEDTVMTNAELQAYEYAQNMKAFHMNWITFLIIMPGLYLLNMYLSPEFMWVWIVAGCWVGAMILHALTIFGLFGLFTPSWEQEQVSKFQSKH